MGDDTIYSGTVAAATEGYLLGIRRSRSRWRRRPRAFRDRGAGRRRAGRAARARAAGAWLLNVNVPDIPLQRAAGIGVTRLGRRHKAEAVIRAQNPRGETVYWVGAAGAAADAGEGTDFHAGATHACR
jgi:5'-nucleotidase